MTYALLMACVVLGLGLLYRFAPSRREAHWHWISPGSVLAACLWLAASILFSLYVSNFASYDATYGSLGAVAVLMLWFYISALVVIFGAELNAELELQTRHDTTSGPARPMGRAWRLRCRPRRRDRAGLSPATRSCWPCAAPCYRAHPARWRRGCRGRAWWNW